MKLRYIRPTCPQSKLFINTPCTSRRPREKEPTHLATFMVLVCGACNYWKFLPYLIQGSVTALNMRIPEVGYPTNHDRRTFKGIASQRHSDVLKTRRHASYFCVHETCSYNQCWYFRPVNQTRLRVGKVQPMVNCKILYMWREDMHCVMMRNAVLSKLYSGIRWA